MWLHRSYLRDDSRKRSGRAAATRRAKSFGPRPIESLEDRNLMSRGVHHVAAVHIARAAQTTPYTQTNLVSDGAVPAAIIDKNLLNPWGIAFKPTTSTPASPFWISDNGKGVATLYKVDPATNTPTTQALVVTIPPGKATTSATATPTGVVFNGNPNEFGGASFIFVTEDGTISAWSGGTSAVLKVDNSANGAVYKGAALATMNGSTFLYVTNFHAGVVEVYNSDFQLVNTFTDRRIHRGVAPFGIKNFNIDGQSVLVVTYAVQKQPDKHDDLAGPGNGFVDVFLPSGRPFLRIASRGPLNSPWGLAAAPASFGSFANDLLVGNFGNGRINAYQPVVHNNSIHFRFAGPLRDASGNPIVIDGLWSLTFGGGGQAGSPDNLFFTAGPNDEQNGLFGSLAPAK